jgi:hypothetical protein
MITFKQYINESPAEIARASKVFNIPQSPNQTVDKKISSNDNYISRIEQAINSVHQKYSFKFILMDTFGEFIDNKKFEYEHDKKGAVNNFLKQIKPTPGVITCAIELERGDVLTKWILGHVAAHGFTTAETEINILRYLVLALKSGTDKYGNDPSFIKSLGEPDYRLKNVPEVVADILGPLNTFAYDQKWHSIYSYIDNKLVEVDRDSIDSDLYYTEDYNGNTGFPKFFNFASLRNGNLGGTGELINELIAQYISTGSIIVKPWPDKEIGNQLKSDILKYIESILNRFVGKVTFGEGLV